MIVDGAGNTQRRLRRPGICLRDANKILGATTTSYLVVRVFTGPVDAPTVGARHAVPERDAWHNAFHSVHVEIHVTLSVAKDLSFSDGTFCP
ncbi:MAG TPA: hypothetical protein VGH17_07375 [Candidatus Acidoferrales bacterium]